MRKIGKLIDKETKKIFSYKAFAYSVDTDMNIYWFKNYWICKSSGNCLGFPSNKNEPNSSFPRPLPLPRFPSPPRRADGRTDASCSLDHECKTRTPFSFPSAVHSEINRPINLRSPTTDPRIDRRQRGAASGGGQGAWRDDRPTEWVRGRRTGLSHLDTFASS